MTPVTLAPSFSFYVRERDLELIARAARFGDAITIAGPNGPSAFMRSSDQVRVKPVIFDGEGYRGTHQFDPTTWAATQRRAGADRVLLPGVLVEWDKTDNSRLIEAVQREAAVARDHDATMVLAIDSRWLGLRSALLSTLLVESGCPAALVPVHRADPLGSAESVTGLRGVSEAVRDLSILRSDHGAVGALAHSAVHAAIGLRTGTRHYAPQSYNPQSFGDRSARLFLKPLLDWYRASEVAGWIAGGAPLTCPLPCCGGGRLDRYLDPHADADQHNMVSLASFADFILDADRGDRAALFTEACRAAVAQYGSGWHRGPTDPKAQLRSWALA